jgi:hypothetical protein
MKVIIRHFDRVKRRLIARNTIHRLTLPQIKRALTDVWREMKLLGLASEQVDEVPVYLVSPLGTFSRRKHFNAPYGFFSGEDAAGTINIPSVSLSVLGDLLLGRPYVSLRDVLRHEYAHAIEHHHGEFIHCDRFEDAFGVAHDEHAEAEFDPAHYVSPYAASCVGQEDYAETFMLYVKHAGALPDRFNTPTIRRKWRFIRDLARRLCRRRKAF